MTGTAMKTLRVLYAAAGSGSLQAIKALEGAPLEARVTRSDDLKAIEASLASGGFDLLLSDYSLPAFDALALLHLRNVTAPGVPVIVLAAGQPGEKCSELIRLGAGEVICCEDLSGLPAAAERALAAAASLKAAAALAEKSRMEALRLLAGSVAHDFNNIIGAIEGYATLNLRTLREDDPLRADLGEIRKAVAKAAELNRRLLLFSRAYPAQPRPVKLEELEAGLRAGLPPGASALEFSSRPGLPPVSGDKAELTQALVNLAVNAGEAMAGGGTVKIKAEADPAGGYVMLSVSDSGPGIAGENLPRLFDPFFSTKPKGKGVGLGLSAVYGIVGRHNGRVEVKTSPSGSTFTVFLPVYSQAAAPAPAAAPAAAGSCRPGTTVLLIEDDAELLAIAARGLAASGYKVLQASTLAGALERLRLHASEVKAVLADIMLPDGRATDAAQEMLRIAPGVCLVFISGYDQSQEVKNLLAGRGFRFLHKPYSIDALLACLAECLRI